MYYTCLIDYNSSLSQIMLRVAWRNTLPVTSPSLASCHGSKCSRWLQKMLDQVALELRWNRWLFWEQKLCQRAKGCVNGQICIKCCHLAVSSAMRVQIIHCYYVMVVNGHCVSQRSIQTQNAVDRWWIQRHSVLDHFFCTPQATGVRKKCFK